MEIFRIRHGPTVGRERWIDIDRRLAGRFFAQFQDSSSHEIHRKTKKISKILLLLQFFRGITCGVIDMGGIAPVLVSVKNLKLHVE